MFEQASNFLFEHIPFIATWSFFTYLTVVVNTRLLDRETIAEQFAGHQALYWLSAFLPMLIMVLSGSIGFFWIDPERRGWDRNTSIAYFVIAGALSLPTWKILEALAKKRGVRIWLPGASVPPPKPKFHDVDTHDL